MKNYKIAVAGTGYVGLSLGVLLSQHHQVVAVDIVQAKVDMINNKKSPIQDDYIEKYLAEKDLNLTATLDAKAAYSDADFVVIAAPTNYDSKTQHFDTSAVETVIKLVMEYNPNAIMVIKSTIPVGYLLDFVPDNIRKISYASSIGVEQLPETLKGKYKKYLKRFDSISVRESKAADVIEKLVNKPVDVVLDPTFLLDGISWHDGYTGTNFNRPAFQKMIVDLKQGDIKVIMVKDLSRLGRDYIGVGDYIEQIFPLMGVRFIAVNNSFDSMKLNNGTPGIEVAVSNLVNNMYSRDIAKKIRAALETNWKNGKATCTNVPFGYVWNKKGGRRWEIDPEAAPCVKKVFELALSGRNTTQIAYGMNELQFPTPGLYAKRKNLLMGSNPIIAPDSEMLWNAAIVWRILRRYEYTGALVMGRRKKIDVNTTSVRTLPEDKWIIAENAHEAIVTKDEYYQAQKAIRNVTPIQYKVGDDFALKGKICCGNCNRQLRHERQYGEMVFYCGYKRSAGKFSKCYGGYYREYSVNAKVARAIKTVFYALDVVNQGMQEKQSITVRCMDIEDLEKQAEAIRVEQIKLYESYADGVLLRDAYIEKKKALSEKLAALQDSIRTEKEEQECADELDEEIRALTKQASEKTYIGGLTKECVDAFVSMVYLYDDQTMKIEFNCEDVIRRALEKYGA